MHARNALDGRRSSVSTAPSRTQLLALAGALTATVVTAGAAVAGLTRHPSQPAPVVPTVDRILTQPSTRTMPVEPGD